MMKKLTKIIAASAVAAISITTVGATYEQANFSSVKADGNGGDIISVVSPENAKSFSVDNKKITEFYEGYEPNYGSNEKFYGCDEYLATPVTLKWTCDNGKYYQVYLSDEKHFVNAEKYLTTETSLTIDNIIPNREYYWKVKVTDNGGAQKFSNVYTFTPTAYVRTMDISGVQNMRDLGGLTTTDGKTIKYGIIYRSAHFDSITEKGKEQIKRLGVKTDIDLRGESSTVSPLGDNVQRLNYNAPYYVDETNGGVQCGLNGAESYVNEFVKEFKACADPNNYPIGFHCSLGRDRTGTLAAMLYAVSGVSRYDIVKEYELSWLSTAAANNPHIQTSAIDKLCNFIESKNGETFKDKACNFLLSIGVTQAELDSVRDILTGKTQISEYVPSVPETPEIPDTLPLPIFADGNCGYTGKKIDGVNVYGGSTVTEMTAEEAAADNVPAGYTGSVLKMTTDTYQMDIVLDFSAQKLTRSKIEGISFRVYVCSTAKDNAKHPEVRIPKPDGWVLRSNVTATKDQWITITLTASEIDALCNLSGGTLGKFALALRSEAATTMYIDEVAVTKKSTGDDTPPIITVKADDIDANVGTYPIEDYTVTDNSGRVNVSLKWSNGALDGKGRLTVGTHTCAITATDDGGNETKKTITYTVTKETELTLYKIIFRSGTEDDIIVTYADGESKEKLIPAVPNKKYYDGVWESFELENSQTQVVNAKYTAIAYTVTFKADGKTVDTQTYTVENKNITEPKVPEKEGYTGKWKDYNLNGGDRTVIAVYEKTGGTDPVDPNPPDPTPTPTPTQPTKKGGCGGSLGGISATLTALGIAAVALKKKRQG
ncbi:MAG: tyrosine-protein phosphatase [Candidatus Borkfalkiaceae bacterium]|nr:tyrosine-protein phosphatase [Christensenellaceae bacterium]